MTSGLTVEPLQGPVPVVTWSWNAETRILSGSFPVPAGRGFTGSVEITGDDGAIVVLDVRGGWLAGLEIVVWPGAEVLPRLRVPAGTPGRIAVPGEPTASGIGVEELETAIDADVTPDRRTIHVLIGGDEPERLVQVADHMVVELDGADRVAGLWLDHVPPAPGVAA